MKIGYPASEKKWQSLFDELVPILEKTGVSIGVQNHCGYNVGSAIGIMHLIEKYDPAAVSAVLDFGHCALDGEPSDMALDIVSTHLSLVNFKSPCYRQTNSHTSRETEWTIDWVTAGHSLYSWAEAVNILKERNYSGDICLTAEYETPDGKGRLAGIGVDRLISEDILYMRELLGASDAG
jgi:sugar phosphate isomerase/epimerase